ncbi:MAG: hypothetical protein ACKVQC_06565 [Elusimicrobiota bacterium]
MNAVTFLRSTDIVGAKEFRQKLDKMLRHPSRPCRVMLHNKPALAVIPDEDFLIMIEIMEELKNEGILDRVTKKLGAEHKKRDAWFWSPSWQKKEKAVDRAIKSGKKPHEARSADEFIRKLES